MVGGELDRNETFVGKAMQASEGRQGESKEVWEKQ
jgi:hypothetical protein